MAATKRRAFTLIDLFAATAIITVLIALLLPVVIQTRDAARRLQCRNNLIQIGLALRNYESAHDCLPPGSVDPNRPIKSEDKGYHFGWAVQILPQLDQPNVFDAYDFSVGVYDRKNLQAAGMAAEAFHCPVTGYMAYSACHHDVEAPIDIDNNGVMFLNSSIRREEIFDGASNTIFVGESGGSGAGLGWASGTRATLRNTGTPINAGLVRPGSFASSVPASGTLLLAVGGFGSGHGGGAFFVFGDGAVRFLNERISLPLLRQLGNRADGELPVQSCY
jgi:type II secretory pathway pseudopilin PulG